MNDERWTELLVNLKDQCATTLAMFFDYNGKMESAAHVNDAFNDIFAEAVSRLCRSDEYHAGDSYVGFGHWLVRIFTGAGVNGIARYGALITDKDIIYWHRYAYVVAIDFWYRYATPSDKREMEELAGAHNIKALEKFGAEHMVQEFDI